MNQNEISINLFNQSMLDALLRQRRNSNHIFIYFQSVFCIHTIWFCIDSSGSQFKICALFFFRFSRPIAFYLVSSLICAHPQFSFNCLTVPLMKCNGHTSIFNQTSCNLIIKYNAFVLLHKLYVLNASFFKLGHEFHSGYGASV